MPIDPTTWSTTPSSNSTIDGGSIADGSTATSHVNNAIRAVMAGVAELVAWFSTFGRTLVGSADAAAARTTLGAAASGANTDLTSIRESATVSSGGTIAASSIGYRGVPASAQSQGSTITLALTDAGKRVANTAGGWTIPANASVAFPTDTTIVLHNNSTSAQTIAITSDTLTLAGTTTTGSRTLAANGLATIVKTGSTNWLISGNVT